MHVPEQLLYVCMYVLFMNFAHHKLDFKTEFALLTKVNDPSKQRVHIFFNLQKKNNNNNRVH